MFKNETVKDKFITILQRWQATRKNIRAAGAVNEVVALGKGAIPYILAMLHEDLNTETTQRAANPQIWLRSLKTLTGVNPAIEGSNLKERLRLWIEWYRQEADSRYCPYCQSKQTAFMKSHRLTHRPKAQEPRKRGRPKKVNVEVYSLLEYICEACEATFYTRPDRGPNMPDIVLPDQRRLE